MFLNTNKKLVYGVGVNDADYVVGKTIGGNQVMCPYYDRWLGMLRRCYSELEQERYPNYIGCTVTI